MRCGDSTARIGPTRCADPMACGILRPVQRIARARAMGWAQHMASAQAIGSTRGSPRVMGWVQRMVSPWAMGWAHRRTPCDRCIAWDRRMSIAGCALHMPSLQAMRRKAAHIGAHHGTFTAHGHCGGHRGVATYGIAAAHVIVAAHAIVRAPVTAVRPYPSFRRPFPSCSARACASASAPAFSFG